MTQDRMAGDAGNTPSKDAQAPKKIGDFVMKPDLIPAEIQTFAKERLGRDAEGNARKDDQGAEIKPSVVPAKENGSYKGRIILNNDAYIVQAVGREEKTAVVHRKEDVELMGSKLKWRDENKKLHNADVQIHYSGDKAKAYPWDKEKAIGEPAKEKAAEKPIVTPEQLLAQAQQYAAENIKNGKQREAFLKHLENVTHQATAPQQQQRQPAPAPEQSRPRPGKATENAKSLQDHGLER